MFSALCLGAKDHSTTIATVKSKTYGKWSRNTWWEIGCSNETILHFFNGKKGKNELELGRIRHKRELWKEILF
jgi:hypothetical protein